MRYNSQTNLWSELTFNSSYPTTIIFQSKKGSADQESELGHLREKVVTLEQRLLDNDLSQDDHCQSHPIGGKKIINPYIFRTAIKTL